jgi:SAM-dependent methyltransferase
VEALNLLETCVSEGIDALFLCAGHTDVLEAMKCRAERVQDRVEEANQRLFHKLRAGVRSGNLAGANLKRLLMEYAGQCSHEGSGQSVGYDALDALVSGVLLDATVPEAERQPEPEMVFYQPVPARVILELVERADFREEDVFYDLGSGLGQVVILVNLLSGVRSKGVEFEPVYCNYARQRAEALNLSGVEFVNADARDADFSDGTAFFLYTPFRGAMLRAVLERLRGEARTRRIGVYTYGPCTAEVARQRWLHPTDRNRNHPYKLAAFTSTQD